MAAVSLLISISVLDWFTECRETLCLCLPVYFKDCYEGCRLIIRWDRWKSIGGTESSGPSRCLPSRKVTCLYLKAPWGLDRLNCCIQDPEHLAFHGSFICGTNILQQQLSGISSTFSPLPFPEVGVVWTEIAQPFSPDLVFFSDSLHSEAAYSLPDTCQYHQHKTLHFSLMGMGLLGYVRKKEEGQRPRKHVHIHTFEYVYIYVVNYIYAYI